MNTLTNCAHCKGTGTCTTGAEGASCQICLAAWRQRNKLLNEGADPKGLRCTCCWGKGRVEPPGATKWDYKTPAYLGGMLAILSFILLFLTFRANNEAFSKSLVFVGTLLGSITGYYFGGQKKVSVDGPDEHRPEAHDQ